MSSEGDPPQENSEPPGDRGRRESAAPPRTNLVEFVDSQDPNVRSAIQRHTAYHSAAQRRDARARLLRRSSQTRVFEWGRRPRRGGSDAPTPSTSGTESSVSISPAPSLSERPVLRSRTPSNQGDRDLEASAAQAAPTVAETASTEAAGTAAEDVVLQLYSATFFPHYPNRASFDAAVAFMRDHDASRHLLLAYAYAMRRIQRSSPDDAEDQVKAQSYLGRGTNLLWNRLRLAVPPSSDANIQAVLLLLAYTADFGQAHELRLHADALRTMVDQRGGINVFGHNPALQHQLWVIERSRTHHLTLSCDPSCPSSLRFPDGLRLGSLG